MNRLKKLSLVITGVAALVSVTAAKQPNVLLISYDDLRPEIGTYGSVEAITPNIDKLADDGTRFANAYVSYPLCLPSRSSMLTGIRYDNSNFLGKKAEKGRKGKEQLYQAMLEMQPVWPKVLHDAGYWTATRGKLYHGNVPKFQRKIWDIPGGFYGTPGPYRITPELKEKIIYQGGIEKDLKKMHAGKAGPGAVVYMAMDCKDNELHDGFMADEVIDYLQNKRDTSKPFLICAGFTLPHLPWMAPKKYFDMYPENAGELAPYPKGVSKKIKKQDKRPISADLWNEGLSDKDAKRLKRAYLATTTYADAQMGKIIDALKKSGEYENTIIILWGDHGYMLSEHGLWQKNKDYRVNMHQPLIIKAPGYKGGQVSEKVVQNIDIYPTILSLCGVSKPKDVALHGNDLTPLLKKPNAKWDHVAHVSGINRRHAIITERYRFTDFGRGEYELYDAQNDPGEWVNQAKNPEYAKLVKKFKKQLKQAVWNKKTK